MPSPAWTDLKSAIARAPFVLEFASLDLRGRYRRTAMGPLWVTVTLGVQIALLGVVFNRLLQTDAGSYFPYLAAGLVVWTFLSSTITGTVRCFQVYRDFILQGRISYFMLVAMSVTKEFLLLLHHFLAFVAVMVIFQIVPTAATLLLPLALLALLVILLPWGLLAAMLNARFRDIEPLVDSVLRAALFFTPVMWRPEALGGAWLPLLVQLNPLAAFIGIVRAPMLGEVPSLHDMALAGGFGVLGWVAAFWLLNRYRRRIAYWI